MANKWYNPIPILKNHGFGLSQPLNPKTRKPYTLQELRRVIPEELAKIELLLPPYDKKVLIDIPSEILRIYQAWRPTPVRRLYALEKLLGTPAQILAKDESVSETGSHKPNTSFMQVHVAKREGATEVVTDTGAGQWGASLALAAKTFGLKCTIFMTGKSYDEKPDRVALMRKLGATVIRSPSNLTGAGKKAGKVKSQSTGSLGLGISEAFEYVKKTKGAKLCMGCMSNYAVIHQTISGMECREQFKKLVIKPDIMIGCVCGGSNFGGFILPFVEDKIEGKIQTKFLAAEAAAVPVFTKGKYEYDWQDYNKNMPMVRMYSLGYNFFPPGIHAGGLRYHGKTPILSKLVNEGIVTAKAFGQNEAFRAGLMYFLAEKVIPAPETAHAIRAVIEEALECKKTGKKTTIVYLHSGNGDADSYAYLTYLLGKLDQETYSHLIPDIERAKCVE